MKKGKCYSNNNLWGKDTHVFQKTNNLTVENGRLSHYTDLHRPVEQHDPAHPQHLYRTAFLRQR